MISQLIVYQVSQCSDWKYISIYICEESIKEKVSINKTKLPDIEEIKCNVKELSIINQNESININKLVSFTSYILNFDSNFKIPELILNGFLQNSLLQIITNIDSKEFQSLSFLRIEGNNKLTMTPDILKSINKINSLVSP